VGRERRRERYREKMNGSGLIVKQGYRRLLKKTRKVFAGDELALAMSKIQLREAFDNNRDIQEEKHLAELIKGIDEADDMLDHIVQGKFTEEGNVTVSLPNPGGHRDFEPLPPQDIELPKDEDDKMKHIISESKNKN
jgi:hypothetical protein